MKYAFFVAGFVVAALLAGTYAWQKGLFRANDDEPIVVAGGSLDFASLNGWKQDKTDPTGRTAIHNHTNRKLSIGLIVYNEGGPHVKLLPAGQMKLEIAYCMNVTCNPDSPDDKVTVSTDANGNKLSVSNTNSQHKIGEEADKATANNSTTISHQFQPDFKIKQIKNVNSADNPYGCDNGKCEIVLVYHCDNSGHC
jgi:hypothetical protein